jgi:hypothetical protein
MNRATAVPPDLVPVLSRGRHRNPRKGACFMEMASYLANERWSDHPRCTHTLLAAVARLVNDLTSDEHRGRLAPLIPSVVGVTTSDPRADVRIALRCALAALPIAGAERQNVLAVAVLSAERALADLEGRPVGEITPDSAEALAGAPSAARFARAFAAGLDVSVKGFRRFGAPKTVRLAALAIAEASVADVDDRLYALLVTAIAECTAIADAERRATGAGHRAGAPPASATGRIAQSV